MSAIWGIIFLLVVDLGVSEGLELIFVQYLLIWQKFVGLDSSKVPEKFILLPTLSNGCFVQLNELIHDFDYSYDGVY